MTLHDVLKAKVCYVYTSRYLKKSLNETKIRKQDAAYVFSAVYTGNSQGVNIAFEFLNNTYKEIAEHYGGMNALGNAIRGLADRLNTNVQIENVSL